MKTNCLKVTHVGISYNRNHTALGFLAIAGLGLQGQAFKLSA
jgi:hypothetical protein